MYVAHCVAHGGVAQVRGASGADSSCVCRADGRRTEVRRTGGCHTDVCLTDAGRTGVCYTGMWAPVWDNTE